MISSSVAPSQGLVNAAFALQVFLASAVTLAAVGAVLLAPSIGHVASAGVDDGGFAAIASVRGLGFSPVDALSAVAISLAVVLWLWVVLDAVYVMRPLSRSDLIAAEAPSLLLGILQTLFGGILPGILLVAASRRTRRAIRQNPQLESLRADTSHYPSPTGNLRARVLGRIAMAGLGVLWGVAGVSMFQNHFYLYLPSLIGTAAQGAPSFLSGWFHFWVFATSLGTQPAVYLAGALQLMLSFALIAGFARKAAYFIGTAMAIFLWVVPEAFGGPFVVAAFSLGPGPAYAIGLVALIGLNATYGRDVATLDSAIQRVAPGWGRVSEVSIGLIPQIGRWYVRNAATWARSAEVSMGIVLIGSAALAWVTGLNSQLGGLLGIHAAGGGWTGAWEGLWARLIAGDGTLVAMSIIGAEGAIGIALIVGLARKWAAVAGLSLAIFVWAVVEGFGGPPGPGYTDPGVGVAEALVFVGLLALIAARGANLGIFESWILRRLTSWKSFAHST